MGKTLAIKDFVAKLGLSDKCMQEQIKPDFFNFEQDDPEGPLTTVEHDCIKVVISRFIDSDAGCKYFKHNRARNEWHFKCSEPLTKEYMLGIVKIWLKSRAKTAKRNESCRQLNRSKPAKSRAALPKAACWVSSKSGNGTINRDRRSSTPLDEADSPSVGSDQAQCQQQPRSESVESDDTDGSLPDIPCRQTEDEEFPDAAEMLNRVREERLRRHSLSSPLHVHTSDSRFGLLSPPTTSRKRIYEVIAAATSTTDSVGVDAMIEDIPSKRARVTFAQTSSATMNQSNTHEQIDLTSETETFSQSPTAVRVNIPAIPRQRRSSHVTSFRSLQSPTQMSDVIAVENTSATPESPRPVSEESTLPIVEEAMVPLSEQPSHVLMDRPMSRVQSRESVRLSSPAPSNQSSKTPCEEYHRQPTEAESASGLIQLVPALPSDALVPEPTSESVTSPLPASTSPFHRRSTSIQRHSQPQPQPQLQPQRLTWVAEPRYNSNLQLSRENLFAILDFLHNHRKTVLSAQSYNEENSIERGKLDDKIEYLEHLRDDAESQISRLNWACK